MGQEAILEVVEPAAERGARFCIAPTGGALAGRDPGNQLELSHPTVSRRHAEFGWTGADRWVADRQSRGGTFVNGRRLTTSQVLSPGDQIGLGAVVLRYRRAPPGNRPPSSRPPPLHRPMPCR